MARHTPQTHDEILAAAARRFAVTGYRGTSLQDIAREVGCSKATVLYHFAGKDALLAELLTQPLAVLRELDERLAPLGGAEARRIGAEGFIDLAVRFRREIALLRGEFPELLAQPTFAHVQAMSERLIAALTGHTGRLADRITALVLLAGISEACAEFADVPEDELRPALLAVARRALAPLDPVDND
ncbi:TetR/AcrR family transcriptional regulator [Micromonospora sp. KC721]|uniref:TetR/AcrR family transcriptional regulator n=1 Tax=Micromonospora sp. KC721 TaxID=2530380 RepID=UPI0010516B12|nr:TetR/AcrR family transcriptional regulator [Micromonospora sp. KC721]TDB79259.1 TetR/AcrR family transcriptional regulator [Micromonospora sp. KC721]